ncbi:MAG TPA: putative porin, partial [Burkholderiaceae bacterium]|nr:putative porin [Burkholderiaceae bacterium]
MRAAFSWLLSLAIVCPAAASADDNKINQVRKAELNLIRGLVEQGVLTREKAIELLRKGGIDPALLDVPTSPVAATPAEPPQVASPQAPSAEAPPAALLPETERKQIVEQVRQEVRAQAAAEGNANPALLPLWVQRISFGGDMRLRYQRNDFAADNADNANGLPPIGLNAAKAIDAWYQLPPGTTQNALDSHEFLF